MRRRFEEVKYGGHRRGGAVGIDSSQERVRWHLFPGLKFMNQHENKETTGGGELILMNSMNGTPVSMRLPRIVDLHPVSSAIELRVFSHTAPASDCVSRGSILLLSSKVKMVVTGDEGG